MLHIKQVYIVQIVHLKKDSVNIFEKYTSERNFEGGLLYIYRIKQVVQD